MTVRYSELNPVKANICLHPHSEMEMVKCIGTSDREWQISMSWILFWVGISCGEPTKFTIDPQTDSTPIC